MKYLDEQSEWEAQQRTGRVGVRVTINESHWRRFVDWLRGRKPYVRKCPNPERREKS